MVEEVRDGRERRVQAVAQVTQVEGPRQHEETRAERLVIADGREATHALRGLGQLPECVLQESVALDQYRGQAVRLRFKAQSNCRGALTDGSPPPWPYCERSAFALDDIIINTGGRCALYDNIALYQAAVAFDGLTEQAIPTPETSRSSVASCRSSKVSPGAGHEVRDEVPPDSKTNRMSPGGISFASDSTFSAASTPAWFGTGCPASTSASKEEEARK